MDPIKNKSALAALILILLCQTFFVACNAKKRYKVMRIFFDGVPKPGEKKSQNQLSQQGRKKSNTLQAGKPDRKKKWTKMISRHPDYFKNVCNNCHDRSAKNFLRVEKKKDLCYTCHKPQQFTGAFVHGPVAVKACLTCHSPHESQYVKLLKKKPTDLCNSCHSQGHKPSKSCLINKACTQCHFPHAGQKRFFLRG